MKLTIDPAKQWYVATFRPRKALDAERGIRDAGFGVYLPRARVEFWSKRGHTYVLVEKPAMPPYMFVGFDPLNKQFGLVSGMDEIGGFLGVDGEPCPVPARIVDAILVAEINMEFDNTPASRRKKEGELEEAFPIGSHVKLIAEVESLLSDMRGEVLGTNGRDKVHVRFGMMKSWLDRKEVRAA